MSDYSAPVFTAVGTTSTPILAANPGRHAAVIVNDSDTPIYLAVGTAAVVGAGIRINAGGGVAHFGKRDLPHTAEAINGVHADTGTKDAVAQETVGMQTGRITIGDKAAYGIAIGDGV